MDPLLRTYVLGAISAHATSDDPEWAVPMLLFCGGTVIHGEVVSPVEHISNMHSQVDPTVAGVDLDDIASVLSTGEDKDPVEYIHLQNVIIGIGKAQNHVPHLRVRASTVDAWTLVGAPVLPDIDELMRRAGDLLAPNMPRRQRLEDITSQS